MRLLLTASILASALLLASSPLAKATQFHVALNGNDANRGTRTKPFRTIQRAAEAAQPGDTITVHQGVYRERVNPPRGGTGEKKRITFQAAPGERVEITGSEPIKTWSRVQGNVWKVPLSNSFFGDFNPYSDVIRGDWFEGKGRQHHTGAVYLNCDWLVETVNLEEVTTATATPPKWLTDAQLGSATNLWFAQVDPYTTTIWAQFGSSNPNEQQVEINVRRTVFYPDKPGRDFITVRGFVLSNAATPWAPPTAEQVGLIGTHWSKGWIIEDNIVSHSICSGISLGKYGDQWDNTSANTAEGYVKTVERALQNGWNRDTIGHHVVRRNTISHCEQAGIVGSLGAAFSTVSDNTIHDIHVRRLFTGAEMAGIKFHGAIDTVIQHNRIYRTCLGLWLDWMAQGTRVSANAFYNNGRDLFVEVDHGPFVVDNNLFLSGASLLDVSEGGAYVHNLFDGTIVSAPEPNRQTPFHPAHSTTLAGLTSVKGGDCRFYNNLFVGRPGRDTAEFGLAPYNSRERSLHTGGNVFYDGAPPYGNEKERAVCSTTHPNIQLVEALGHASLRIEPGAELKQAQTSAVTTSLLGKAQVSGVAYENPDSSPLKINTDYFGNKRDPVHPTPGPFENLGTGPLTLKLW